MARLDLATEVPTGHKAKPHFRADIQGLRALAIIPVVAFHAGLLAIPGGFIGVDIFYVISGYLITSILLREAETTGTVRLATFWAKRVRRLAPAMALVVLVTLPAGLLVLSPLVWQKLATDAVATLLYVSNMAFAMDSTNYFADDLGQSPFLHTWSLSVEEQFYIVWPVLIIAAAWLSRRRGKSLRAVLIGTFAATAVLSFALSLYMTQAYPGPAFYVLPTRAWEFAAAGLLAAVPLRKLLQVPGAASVLRVAGLALLVAGFLIIKGNDPFPGTAALVPVIGTLLLLAAGTGGHDADPVARLLASAPLQWVGTVSYSWYLWHWPAIILTAAALQNESPWIKCAAGVGALGLAALTHKYVENRFRTDPRFASRPRRTFIPAAAMTAAVAVLAAGVFAGGSFLLAQPAYAKFAEAQSAIPDQSCTRTTSTPSGLPLCEMGDVDAAKTVMLLGDSHAGHWKAAMSQAAEESGVRLLMRWKSSCPIAGTPVLDTKGHKIHGCPEFREETLAILAEEKPEGVILSQANAYDGRILSESGSTLSESAQLDRWGSTYFSLVKDIKALGINVAAIEDNPRTTFDPLLCATRLTTTPADCVTSRSESLANTADLTTIDREVWKSTGVTDVLNTTDLICDPATCNIVDADGTPIYRDYNHLSEAWTMEQAPALQKLLDQLA